MSFPFQEPTLIPGGCAVDDRGQLTFVNGFNFPGVKRFYMIENHHLNFVRAWHGHKIEGKFLMAVQGSFVVGAVKLDSFEKPSANLEPKRVVLSAQSPSIFAIPPGYANGLMNLSEGAKMLVLSTTSMEESKNDDFRFEARHWDIWNVVER